MDGSVVEAGVKQRGPNGDIAPVAGRTNHPLSAFAVPRLIVRLSSAALAARRRARGSPPRSRLAAARKILATAKIRAMPAYCPECRRQTYTIMFAACEHKFCSECLKGFGDCPSCHDPVDAMWRVMPAER